jgi:hypothetical protein
MAGTSVAGAQSCDDLGGRQARPRDAAILSRGIRSKRRSFNPQGQSGLLRICWLAAKFSACAIAGKLRMISALSAACPIRTKAPSRAPFEVTSMRPSSEDASALTAGQVVVWNWTFRMSAAPPGFQQHLTAPTFDEAQTAVEAGPTGWRWRGCVHLRPRAERPPVSLAKGKPNSLFPAEGTSIIIHAGKNDYKTDSHGGSGDRIACGVIEATK